MTAGFLLIRKRREEREQLWYNSTVRFDGGGQAVDIELDVEAGLTRRREKERRRFPLKLNHRLGKKKTHTHTKNTSFFLSKDGGLVSFHSGEETVVECLGSFCWFESLRL